MVESWIRILAISVVIQITLCDKLLLVNTLWRHGERTPDETFPTDPYLNYPWHNGMAQLTALGMKNQFNLGKWLRQKYVDDNHLLSPIYNQQEIYVKSTDTNRTILSAVSNMNGMYSYRGIPGLDFPLIPDWPIGYVPIPIHTLTPNFDYTVGFPEPCKRRAQLLDLISQSPEWSNWVASNQELIANVSALSGLPVTDIYFNVVRLFYAMTQTKDLGLPLAQWENDYYNAIQKVFVQYNRFNNGYDLGLVNGINVTLEIRKIQGGSILWDMINRMQYKTACFTGSNTLDCSWLNKLKYYAISAHEPNIAAIFSTFGFTKYDFNIDLASPQNAVVMLELWAKNNNKTYVKVFYRRPNQPEIDITNNITGCEHGCSLDQFAQRSTVYQPLPNVLQLCNTLIV